MKNYFNEIYFIKKCGLCILKYAIVHGNEKFSKNIIRYMII
jgi:hypothetical protein